MIDLKQLEKDLAFEEGVKLFPYLCTAKKRTIGIGRNFEDNPLTAEEVAYLGCGADVDKGITKEEAYYLLRNDITAVVKDLDRALPWWTDLPEPAGRALANMRFQLGLDGVKKFKKFLAALESGDFKTAAVEMMDSKWAKIDSPNRAKRLRDLVKGCVA